jgi:hypothetical protein
MPPRLKVTSAPRPFVRSPTGWRTSASRGSPPASGPATGASPSRPSAGSTTGCLATPTTVRAAVATTRMGSAPKAAAERSRGAPEPDSVTGHRQRLDQSADVGSEVTGWVNPPAFGDDVLGEEAAPAEEAAAARRTRRRSTFRRRGQRGRCVAELAFPCRFCLGVRVRASCVRVRRFRSAGSAWLEPRVGGPPFSGDHIPAGRDMASERITWETCPRCGLTAAVGWLGGVPVEFDCTAGCAPTEQVLGRLRRPAGGSSSLARWADATRLWR